MVRQSRWWTWALLLAGQLGAGAGCGQVEGQAAPTVAQERSLRAPARPHPPMRKLTPARGAHPAPDTTLSLAPGVSVDARALVITADGTDPAFDAIVGALGFLGTPYDVLNATSGPALTEAMLADGAHGKYQAIFLDLGDLSVAGTSAFSDAEWLTLASYEAQFGVRRVVFYASPTADYGLGIAGEVDPSKAPIAAHCTAAGAAAFVSANCAAPIAIDLGWAYPATTVDSQTTPLLVDDAGHVLAATHVYPDGREALVLTFAQSTYALFTLELGYGLVDWATRGLFIGEHHVYLSAQLDDFFLASTIYGQPGATYRITDTELQGLADWQANRRANPLVAGLRLAWAANAQGSGASDPLTAKAVALGPTFAWINHTWDHADLTVKTYADALVEFTRNDQAIRALGLVPYATENLVTPGITGLANPNAMLAALAAGVRYLVSDTSIACQGNPSPNAGFSNALVPGLLELPRIPTNLFYDVSRPEEWTAEYKALVGVDASYAKILDSESRTLTGYLLAGNDDPWMFHQENARDIGGGHSLLTDLLDATLDRYLGMATFPVLSPTMEELAELVIARMTFDVSGVVATIEPDQRLTIKVTNAARVPVTGVCTPDAEKYGGQTITHLDLPAGATVTLSLADCNDGPTGGSDGGVDGGVDADDGEAGEAGGASGAGGGSGAVGTGYAGTSGSSITGGYPNPCTSGGAGMGGSAGESGAGGATGPTGSGGSSTAGTTGGPAPPGGCGCAFGDGAPPSLGLALTALGGLVVARRRHRRARP